MLNQKIILSSDGQATIADGFASAGMVAPDGDHVLKGRATDLDFAKIKVGLYRNRYLIGLTIAAFLAAGLLVTLMTTRIYRATASVQLEEQSSRVLNTQDVEPSSNGLDSERFLQTQVDILTSRSLAIRVGDQLNLFKDDEFLIAMNRPPSTDAAAIDQRGKRRDRVIAALQDNLAVQLPRNSRVAQINYYSPQAVLASSVANAYAQALIADNLERRYQTSSYARGFLERQLGETKARLEASERNAINYARSAGLIDTTHVNSKGEREGPVSLSTDSLIAMNSTLSAVSAERLRAQERWLQARATPTLSLPEVNGNAAIQHLFERKAELRAEYEKQLERHLPEFPSVQEAKAQVDEVESQISSLSSSIKNSIQRTYIVAQQQEGAVTAQLANLRATTLSEQQRGIQYNILRREVDTNRELYDGLLQRFKEVGAAAGVTANNITVVDVAEPRLIPSSPKPLLNMVLALFVGLFAAAALAIAREWFDDSIRSPDDVEAKLGVPLLGAVPKSAKDASPVEELDDLRSPLSEAYASIRFSLEFAGTNGFPRSILVTSGKPSEGKSTTSYAIARSLAQIGKRVVLLDGDLRKPSLHRVMGTQNLHGFSTLLIGQADIAKVLLPTDQPNFWFIPSGPLPPNPAELCARESVQETLRLLLEQFDVVILDGPPVMGLADAPSLAASVEATVFLVDSSQSHRGRSRVALRRLQKTNGHVIGVILTKFDARQEGYGGYGYSYEYGSDRSRSGKAQLEPAD